MHSEMTGYKVVIHRGGTSKGIFLKENELPRTLKQEQRSSEESSEHRIQERSTDLQALMYLQASLLSSDLQPRKAAMLIIHSHR